MVGLAELGHGEGDVGGHTIHEEDNGPGDLVLLHVGDKILEDEGEGLASDAAVGSGGEAPGARLPILGQTGQVVVGDIAHTLEEAARWCHLTSSVHRQHCCESESCSVFVITAVFV